MKINWGTAIVIAFVLFISFIMYFVVRSMTDDGLQHELVTEGYYKKELGFQEELDAAQRASDMGLDIAVERTEEGLMLRFPTQHEAKEISGTVFLYRPSNKQFDFEVPISLSDPHLLIPENRFLDGRWNMVVQWKYKGESYRVKKAFTY